MIQLKNIVKSYPMGNRELTVLHGVDLNIDKGEMVAIMGPSGSGKSTLLNMIGLLDRPTSGSYVLDGKEVSKLNPGEQAKVSGQQIGFIFQSFNLLGYLSALGNVELGQKYASKIDSKVAKEALAKKPPVILADESTGNLDSHTSKDIMSILTKLHKEQGITLIMITHDPNTARYCQRIVHIEDGQILKEEVV